MDKTYKIEINGQAYTITSEQPKEVVDKITEILNQKLSAVAADQSKVPLTTTLLIAALNLAEDLYLEQEATDRIREQVTEYAMEIAGLKAQNLEYKNKYERLIEELKRNGK